MKYSETASDKAGNSIVLFCKKCLFLESSAIEQYQINMYTSKKNLLRGSGELYCGEL